MSEPNLFDYVPERTPRPRLGPKASAFELARALVEMQTERAKAPPAPVFDAAAARAELANKPIPSIEGLRTPTLDELVRARDPNNSSGLIKEGGFSMNLPPPDRRPDEVLSLDLYKALDAAGGGRHDPAKVRDFIQKDATQGQRNQVFGGLRTVEQRADFLNDKPVAPVEFEGGHFFDKYSLGKPHLGIAPETPGQIATRQHVETQKRDEEAAIALKKEQLRRLRGSPNGEPRLASFGGGPSAYYQPFLSPDGNTRFHLVEDENGNPLTSPPPEPTAYEREVGFIAKTFGISLKEAADKLQEKKSRSMADRRVAIAERVMTEKPQLINNPAAFNAEVNARLALIDPASGEDKKPPVIDGAKALADLLAAINPNAAATDRTLAPFRQNAAPGVPQAPRTLPPPIPGPSAPAGVVMTDKSGRRVKSLGNGQWQPVP